MATLLSMSERKEMVSKSESPSLSDLVSKTPSTKVPSNKDHVHTWKENPDHNLATVQKDVIPAGSPTEHAGVTSTVVTTVYADEAEQDDKGLNPTPPDAEPKFSSKA